MLLAPWTISASSFCSGIAARTAFQRRSSSPVEIGLHRRSSATLFLPNRYRCSLVVLSYMQILRDEHPGTEMIVDFQHHFTPRELIKQDPGDRLVVNFDENGAPSYTV